MELIDVDAEEMGYLFRSKRPVNVVAAGSGTANYDGCRKRKICCLVDAACGDV